MPRQDKNLSKYKAKVDDGSFNYLSIHIIQNPINKMDVVWVRDHHVWSTSAPMTKAEAYAYSMAALDKWFKS